ncbi:mitochondrial distribution and morphology protein 10 [Mycena rosella]|uniref:Mitochondrial distribution and morphology protein 10 n=1 Tax=Mycena rosella TaxID=1033263 RepID=A0AAD7DU54_MYCRO|nr:mitochondrial distribution and morphology protein 10 [Mycena rosella]
MLPFASYVLRSYYKATGWNEDNLYANLTRSSNAILDFTVPRGLHLSVSKSPNSLFKTTYSMNAMPSLNGSVASGNVRFKDMIERFRVYDQPRRPEAKEEEWLAGERVDKRDYLLYGRFYLPTGRLDALYSTRLTPTLQALVAAISHPPSNLPTDISGRSANVSNLIVNLQHDVGKWCTEYTYSADDSMWGVRVLHNFGKLGIPVDTSDDNSATPGGRGLKRVDEEDAVEGGLKGRVSAGAEFYFSAKERSAGVSTGFRFTTLPDATPPSFQLPGPSSSPLTQASKGPPSQPPTTITALFNPMLGHMSGAYSARVSRDLSLSSRFDFNVYSYESEWTMGAEWWMRSPLSQDDPDDPNDDAISIPPPRGEAKGEVRGVVKARASTNNVSLLTLPLDSTLRMVHQDVSLMWEGRLRNMLVSLGVVSDFSNRTKPIKAIGLELSYFSSDGSNDNL